MDSRRRSTRRQLGSAFVAGAGPSAHGLRRSTLYRWIKKGLLPLQVKIGPRRVAWRKSDVDRWIATRSRAGASGRTG